MPYESDRQRRFMHAKHPEVAAKWDAEIRKERRRQSGRGVSKGVRMSEVRKAANDLAMDYVEEPPMLPPSYRRGANYRTGTAGVGHKLVESPESARPFGKADRAVPTKRVSGLSAKTSKNPRVPSMQAQKDESKCPITPSLVGKRSRKYEPEDARQRRYGAASGAAAIGGGELLRRGGTGIHRTTTKTREAVDNLKHLREPDVKVGHYESGGNIKRGSKLRTLASAEQGGLQVLTAGKHRPIVASPRHLALVGGGVAALGAAGGMLHRGKGRANWRWD